MRPLRHRGIAAGALLALTLGGLAVPLAAQGDDTATAEAFAPMLVTVDTHSRQMKEQLQTLGLDLTEHAGHDYIEVVLHTANDLARLEDAGFTYDVRIPDLVARSIEVRELDEAYAASTAVSALPSGRTGYRTLADYNADLTTLATEHPRLVKPLTLPHVTLDGYEVHAIEIGSDVTRPESGRPVFLLMGLHHAREWPSGELAMEFAFDLVKGYGNDDRITGLLDRARVIVVPVVNPDGFDLSRTDGEFVDLRDLNDSDPLSGTTSVVATPGHAYKRKNCRVVDGEDIPDGSCRATLTDNLGAGIGVDLNRNYGGFWGGPGAAAPEPDPASVELGVLDPTYRGASPFSEPETQNIRELISSRQVTMMISNHTYSNLILRPNGVHPQTIGPDGLPVGNAPDEQAMKDLGAEMAASNGYRNIHGWELYDTTGTTEDWSYNTTGGFGYTFEIGPDEFHPPFDHVVEEYVGAGEFAGKGNRAAYLTALEAAVAPSSHAILTGRAPRGAELRLTKSFQTPTWSGTIEDGVDTAMRVGRRGRVTWHVNPSTRPVVMSRDYLELADEPLRSETFEGTAPLPPALHTDHDFTITEQGVAAWELTLDWTTPDDLDLEVYRHQGNELVQVGSSGNFPGEKEATLIADPVPGDYVIRVVNFASVTPSYTLTSALFNGTTETTKGSTESYDFTCTVDGRVAVSRTVTVARGERLTLPLRMCRKIGKVERPQVLGRARVGKQLKATRGEWSTRPGSAKFQWLRNGKRIKGADSRRYQLRPRDAGKRITVRVTVNKPTYDATSWKAKPRKVRRAR